VPEERRPLFASDFPRLPAVDALVDAFARGDYARVRAEGRRLVESEKEDESVRRAARTLVSRTDPDPLAVWLLVLAGVLLVVLSVYWIGQRGASPAPAAPAPARLPSSSQ
jgi:hypothetical protein